MKQTIKRFSRWLAFPALTLGFVLGHGQALAQAPETIHMEIVSAPVVPNGIVASEPTEFNVLLRRDGVDPEVAMDPAVKGLQIPKGGRMEVELSGFFANPDLGDFFRGRNIILTTGPQNPVRPPPGGCVTCGNWVASLLGNVITVKPEGGDGENGLEGERAAQIGFKVIHVRPDTQNRSHEGTPFYNGRPGRVGTVDVRIYDAGDNLMARGSVSLRFRPRAGKQVHLSNVRTRDDNSINSNTNFQRVAPGTEMEGTSLPDSGVFGDGLPYAPQFLIFEDTGVHDQQQFPTGDVLPEPGGDSFIPFTGIGGVIVVPSDGNPLMAHLKQNGSTVGRVVMTGPTKRSGGRILLNDEPTVVNGNGSVLFVPVKVGSEPGQYTVTVYMNGGGSATNTIVVK